LSNKGKSIEKSCQLTMLYYCIIDMDEYFLYFLIQFYVINNIENGN